MFIVKLSLPSTPFFIPYTLEAKSHVSGCDYKTIERSNLFWRWRQNKRGQSLQSERVDEGDRNILKAGHKNLEELRSSFSIPHSFLSCLLQHNSPHPLKVHHQTLNCYLSESKEPSSKALWLRRFSTVEKYNNTSTFLRCVTEIGAV